MNEDILKKKNSVKYLFVHLSFIFPMKINFLF